MSFSIFPRKHQAPRDAPQTVWVSRPKREQFEFLVIGHGAMAEHDFFSKMPMFIRTCMLCCTSFGSAYALLEPLQHSQSCLESMVISSGPRLRPEYEFTLCVVERHAL